MENDKKVLGHELHMYHCAGGHTRSLNAKATLVMAGFRFEGSKIFWPDGVKLTYDKAGNIEYRCGFTPGLGDR